MELIDRAEEAARLRELAVDPPALVIVRGRRRIGKSYLLRAALPEHRRIYHQADELSERAQLEALAREVWQLAPATPAFADWDSALRFIGGQAANAPLTLVLDEFQYLAASQPALPSIIQRHWDAWQRERIPILIVLSGSALSFMEGLMRHDPPLYGRAAYRPLLEPFDYRIAADFASPHLSPAARIARYAVLGGTPQYQVWAGDRPLGAVLRRQILSPGTSLYEEPLQLLRSHDDVRDPAGYFTALQAIARGATKTGEVAAAMQVRQPSATEALGRLRDLGYVELKEPLESDEPLLPGRSRRRGVWRIADPYFRFWFRYVLPNRSRLEQGEAEAVATDIERDLDSFVGPVFEECCWTWLWRYSPSEVIRSWREMGSWWSRKGDVEVDIVAMRQQRYTLVAECKWSKNPVGVETLDKLQERRAVLGGRAAQARLALFARAGFTDALVDRATVERVLLVTADDLFADSAAG